MVPKWIISDHSVILFMSLCHCHNILVSILQLYTWFLYQRSRSWRVLGSIFVVARSVLPKILNVSAWICWSQSLSSSSSYILCISISVWLYEPQPSTSIQTGDQYTSCFLLSSSFHLLKYIHYRFADLQHIAESWDIIDFYCFVILLSGVVRGGDPNAEEQEARLNQQKVL